MIDTRDLAAFIRRNRELLPPTTDVLRDIAPRVARGLEFLVDGEIEAAVRTLEELEHDVRRAIEEK